MEEQAPPKILRYQSLGFLAIIGLCWLDDHFGLSALVLGDHPFVSRFHPSIVSILFVFAIWFLVMRSTRRVLERVKYLEAFLKVCAWCRRIDHQGHWMPLEDFMQQGFDTPTSHGICEDCLAQQKAAAERAKQARLAATLRQEESAG
ncbi:MAG: hypothetical protein ACTHLW_04485 [Verrucomicrobiota bacterium]